MARTKKGETALATTPAIKGFDASLKCRDFQFALGETYKHEGPVKACKGGFHAITGHPLAVFQYYAPAGSRFCRVELSGATDTDDNEKIASEILTVGEEIGITDLVNDAVKWVLDRAKPEGERATGDRGAASATGDQGAASATGYQGAASATGDRGAASATGTRGAASATGTRGAASATGYHGAASATGYQGAASATGDQGAASATGYQGAASATGTRGAASATGDRGAASATGTRGAAMTSGHLGQVRGTAGNALFACERETWDGPIISVAAGIVGQDGIEPNRWYRCVGGKLVEAARW
jgi:hypothetical protein